MRIFHKEKKQIIWAIPVWIGVLIGVFGLSIYIQSEPLNILITLLIGFIGGVAVSSHIYGIINMIVNDDFSANSPNRNRAYVQVLYLIFVVVISYYRYWAITYLPLKDKVFSLICFIFTLYAAFFLAAIMVIVISTVISYIMNYIISHANTFPEPQKDLISYDATTVGYVSIPIAICIVFIIYFGINYAELTADAYFALWYYLPLILLFSLDLSCMLIRSLPKKKT